MGYSSCGVILTRYENEGGRHEPCAAFDFKDEGTLYLEGRCPKCGRFVTLRGARVSIDWNGHVKSTTGFRCAQCGYVTPRVMGWF